MRDGSDDRHAAVDADDGDVADGIEGRDQRRQPAWRQHQRVAAGQDHFPDFGVCADVVERRVQFGVAQRLAAWPYFFSAEAEAAIDRAGMQWLQQNAVGIAVHDAFDRRAGLVADRVGEFLGRDHGLGGRRHELARDRIAGDVAPVDQRQHFGRERDRHGLRGGRKPRIGRDQPLAFQGIERAQGGHCGLK